MSRKKSKKFQKLLRKRSILEEKTLPIPSNKQVILKDIVLVVLSITIGFLFSINIFYGVICLIIFVIFAYVIMLEILNMPLVRVFNIKIRFKSKKDAYGLWYDIKEGFTPIFDILRDLIENRKKWPKGQRIADIGDFSDELYTVISSTKYDVIGLIKNTLKNNKVKYTNVDEESFSLLKDMCGFGKSWKMRGYYSRTQFWYMERISISITGHGKSPTFDALCDKLDSLKDYERDDDGKNLKIYSYEEQNVFSGISCFISGSKIIVFLDYTEKSGVSDRPTILIETVKELNKIIKDLKKYHKKAGIFSEFNKNQIEAYRRKTEQKDSIRIQKVFKNYKNM